MTGGGGQDVPWPHLLGDDPAFTSERPLHVVYIGGANPAFFPFSAAAEYDSWLTVGPTDGSAEGAISQVGFDFESW